MVTVCSVCQRLKDGEEWKKGHSLDPMVSHGYCPECYNKVMGMVEKKTAAREKDVDRY